MKQLLDPPQTKIARILQCRTQNFESFLAVYILSENDGLYAISVITLDPTGAVDDSTFIPKLCTDFDETQSMFDAVFNGGVTPCTLADVLEDMIGI